MTLQRKLSLTGFDLMRKITQFSSHFLLDSGALVINNQIIIFSHSTEPDRQKATGKEKVKPLLKLTEKTLFRKQNSDVCLVSGHRSQQQGLY